MLYVWHRWVRSVAVEPGNEWFATGSADRTIKIWDLASGQLKLTLTGHIEQVLNSSKILGLIQMLRGNEACISCCMVAYHNETAMLLHLSTECYLIGMIACEGASALL